MKDPVGDENIVTMFGRSSRVGYRQY